jgi:hypothetical protein
MIDRGMMHGKQGGGIKIDPTALLELDAELARTYWPV